MVSWATQNCNNSQCWTTRAQRLSGKCGYLYWIKNSWCWCFSNCQVYESPGRAYHEGRFLSSSSGEGLELHSPYKFPADANGAGSWTHLFKARTLWDCNLAKYRDSNKRWPLQSQKKQGLLGEPHWHSNLTVPLMWWALWADYMRFECPHP